MNAGPAVATPVKFQRPSPSLRRRFIKGMVACAISLVTLVAAVNVWMVRGAAPLVFSDEARLPYNPVGLVLGTSKRLVGGAANPHFHNRMAAAAKLYFDGKVGHLLLSGSNQDRNYDEPTDMKNALLALGVPEAAMTLDYAGLRTLDSVVRAKEIFGLSKFTVVTDEFHAYRAIFLCRRYGIEAAAYPSADVAFLATPRARFREYGARVKAALDVYVLHTQPKFLGPRIDINAEPFKRTAYERRILFRAAASGGGGATHHS
jgi:SanA protein